MAPLMAMHGIGLTAMARFFVVLQNDLLVEGPQIVQRHRAGCKSTYFPSYYSGARA